jgi:copper(I)-binding protein
VSRSIRTTRVAGLAVLAIAGMFATGCSAGLTAQTAAEKSAVDGASGNAGSIALRNVRLAYPAAGQYPAGSDATLAFAAANSGSSTDSLVSIQTSAAASVMQVVPVTTGSATQSPTGTATGSPTATATDTATATGGPAPATALVPTPIPAGQLVTFGTTGSVIRLVGLTNQLLPAQNVRITFTFASGHSVTLNVPVTTPLTEVPAPPSTSAGS